jgi:hypothetical protein
MRILAPLVVLTIFFGVYPAPILDATAASVENLIKNYAGGARRRGAADRARCSKDDRTMTFSNRPMPLRCPRSSSPSAPWRC